MARGPGQTSASTSGAGPLQGVVLEREAGGWRFESMVERLLPADAQGVDPAEARLLVQDASFTVRVRLPGKVVATNADERGADGDLIWKIDVLGDARTLSARTQAAGSGSPAAMVLAGGTVATAALIAGAALWFSRRRPIDGTDVA